MFIRFYAFRFIEAMLVIPQKLYEQFTRKTIQYLGPVFTTAQNFVCSGKKLVNGKPLGTLSIDNETDDDDAS